MRLLFKGRNRITSGYRLPERKDHNGLDIVGIDSRDILCPVDGIVKSSTMITDHSNLTWQWGNYVRVDDDQGRRLFFCHMDSRAVTAGQKVKRGDKLGIMGNTGYSFGAHTHFEVRDGDGKTILDPAEYLGVPNKLGTYSLPEGWAKDTLGWYWYRDGEKVKGEWVLDGGYWYYLGMDGRMQTGLKMIGGKLYMLNPERAQGVPKGACIITDEHGAMKEVR